MTPYKLKKELSQFDKNNKIKALNVKIDIFKKKHQLNINIENIQRTQSTTLLKVGFSIERIPITR
jgi:hypothetical protein